MQPGKARIIVAKVAMSAQVLFKSALGLFYWSSELAFNQEALLESKHQWIAGNYWSSTENSGNPQNNAWNQNFASGGGSNQNNDNKNNQLGVRCSRGFK